MTPRTATILRHVVIVGVLTIALPLGVPGFLIMMWRSR